jgi:hypothetical protein
MTRLAERQGERPVMSSATIVLVAQALYLCALLTSERGWVRGRKSATD